MPAKVNESSFIFIVRVWRYGAFIQLALQRQIDVVVVVVAAAVLARVFGVGNLQFRQAILCVAFLLEIIVFFATRIQIGVGAGQR